MRFFSVNFLLFMIIVLFVYYLTPFKYRWIGLLVAGFFFYSHFNPYYLILLVIPTIIVYFIALRIETVTSASSATYRKRRLILGIIFALIGLVVYKYSDFLGATFYTLLNLFSISKKYTPLNWLLPIGISFYTFKLLSYLLDVYYERLKAEQHLGYFALYVSFFPQLLAGPIERAPNFIPQLKKHVPFNFSRILDSLKIVAWGAFKKLVIADRLTPAVDMVFDNVRDYRGPELLIAVLFFSIQIYCDFSGYSDIAIGLAGVFGYNTMENFKAPYFSRNIRKFWNRWHISLSTWLRDYLFLPITYAVFRKVKEPRLFSIRTETAGYIIGMSITMFLGGLWHGASWTFVLWGLIHGIYLILSYTTQKVRRKFLKWIGIKKNSKLHRRMSTFTTFCMVSFAWIFFRANSIEDAIYVCSNLHVGILNFFTKILGNLVFKLNLEPLKAKITTCGFTPYDFFFLAAAIIIMMFVERNQDKIDIWLAAKAKPAYVRFLLYYLLVMGIFLFAKTDGGNFIYFQF